MRDQRSLLILIVSTILLLALGTVVALAAGDRAPAAYPRTSPQAAVSTYLRLLQSGQVDAAYQLTAFSDVNMSDINFHQEYDTWSQQSHRATLVQVQSSPDAANVTVDLATFSGGAFGASDQTSRQTFMLERFAGAWHITSPEYLY